MTYNSSAYREEHQSSATKLREYWSLTKSVCLIAKQLALDGANELHSGATDLRLRDRVLIALAIIAAMRDGFASMETRFGQMETRLEQIYNYMDGFVKLHETLDIT